MSHAHLKLIIKAFRKKHFYTLEKLLQECKNEDQQYTILAVIHGRKKDRGHVREKYVSMCKMAEQLKEEIFNKLPFMRYIYQTGQFDSFYDNF